MKFRKISRRRSRSPATDQSNAELNHFKLLLCRGPQRNVQRLITRFYKILFSAVIFADVVVVLLRFFYYTHDVYYNICSKGMITWAGLLRCAEMTFSPILHSQPGWWLMQLTAGDLSELDFGAKKAQAAGYIMAES